MDLVQLAADAMSVPIILGIFGLTFVVQIILKWRLKYVEIPDWLIVVPWVLGFLSGFAQYYGDTNITADPAITWYMHLLRACTLSMMYAGGAVILYKTKNLIQDYLPKLLKKASEDMPRKPIDGGTDTDAAR